MRISLLSSFFIIFESISILFSRLCIVSNKKSAWQLRFFSHYLHLITQTVFPKQKCNKTRLWRVRHLVMLLIAPCLEDNERRHSRRVIQTRIKCFVYFLLFYHKVSKSRLWRQRDVLTVESCGKTSTISHWPWLMQQRPSSRSD